MMTLYRCGKCKYITDVSGFGAHKVGGRWNSKGVYMLYTASNPSLALLECVVHMTPILPDASYCMLKMNTSEDSVLTLTQSELKPGWESQYALEYCKRIGDQFIASGRYLILKVPSAVLPMEWNLLVNPKHHLMHKIIQESNIPILIDPRIKK